MTHLFQEHYANAYDLVYREKNYRQEVEAVTTLLTRFATREVRTLIDLGCGTGRHAEVLLDLGYKVTGVDLSEPMLAIARRRLEDRFGAERVALRAGDIRALSIGNAFDAALMMFNVIGYMTNNDDLLAALRSVHRHLVPGGLLVFDMWYGPAVVKDPPGDRLMRFENAEGSVLRFVEGRHDRERQACDIAIHLLDIVGDRIRHETRESHRVRYFFPMEIDLALRLSGFQLVGMHGFPDVDSTVSADRWSAVAVAAATGSSE